MVKGQLRDLGWHVVSHWLTEGKAVKVEKTEGMMEYRKDEPALLLNMLAGCQ